MTSLAYGINLASSLLSLTSPQSIWLIIGQFQLLMLLLLTGAYIPKFVADYLAGMDYTLFSFSFLKTDKWNFLLYFKSWFDYKQENVMLDFIGIKSGSTLINNLSLIFMFIIMMLLHAFVLAIYKIIKKHNERKKR